MKSFFTKIFFAVLITFSLAQLSNAQVYIWGGPGDVNSEFANGLNDWTTSNENNAFWNWTANGMGDDGSYWGTRGPINSASVANGAALFNSDKFHSVDGIAYPHRGELTSPVFSCEGHSTVFVRFDQITRFWDSGNQTFLQVSTDGGNTWLPADGYNSNPDILRYNFASFPREEQKLFDISEFAANQPSVQIRFVWQGSYYYWIIDDVYVMEQPEVDLEISAVLYEPLASQVPVTQMDAREMSFAINLPNHGSMDVTNAVVGVNVTDADGAIVYTDSLTDITVLSGDTTEVNFTNTFLPSDGINSVGTHFIEYWTYVPEVQETNTADNGYGERFFVSEDYYDMSYYTPFNAWGLENYALFNIFETGSWSDNDEGYVFIADSVNMACTDGADEDTFLADVNLFLYKVHPDVLPDFSNFEKETPAQLDPGEDAHPQLEMVGFGFETSFQGEDYTEFMVGLYDIDFNERVALEPDSRYILMAYWDNDKSLYHVADRYKYLNGLPASGWFSADTDGNWAWDFDPWYGWMLGLQIQYVVGTETTPLPDNTLQVFPNPADTDINIDINFETTVNEATIVLTDINNRYINSMKLENFNSISESMNVSNVPSGNYILRLVTEQGSTEQKVIIQH
jgi:hypothetical protein